MDGCSFRFACLADAIAAVQALAEPVLLTRFDAAMAGRLIIAVSPSAASDPLIPRPGGYPDDRRDREVTADVELDYLYAQLVERGHAGQVISVGGRLRELSVTRVYIENDDAVYGFVSPRSRGP